jgi:hypothetical protein
MFTYLARVPCTEIAFSANLYSRFYQFQSAPLAARVYSRGLDPTAWLATGSKYRVEGFTTGAAGATVVEIQAVVVDNASGASTWESLAVGLADSFDMFGAVGVSIGMINAVNFSIGMIVDMSSSTSAAADPRTGSAPMTI